MLRGETLGVKLEHKTESLNKALNLLLEQKNIDSLTEKQKRLIYNNQYNTSVEEMRDLIERLMIENYDLKK